MASRLIRYLRLMVEGYLYDSAYQAEEEQQPYSLVESTTVLGGFSELMVDLEARKKRDDAFRGYVDQASARAAAQLNEAILLNANELKFDDEKLLAESLESIRPVPRPQVPLSDKEGVRELLERSRQEYEIWRQAAQAEADLFGISIEDMSRWHDFRRASEQDVEVPLLKYLLVKVSQCKKDELHRDMLKIEGLHRENRYSLKRTVREAFLCRVMGFDQAAAALCGAAVEAELRQRLLALELIVLKDGKWPVSSGKGTTPGEPLDARGMANEAHANGGFRGGSEDVKAETLQRTHRILELRNSALHDPELFGQKIKTERYARFVPDTREVLEALQPER